MEQQKVSSRRRTERENNLKGSIHETEVNPMDIKMKFPCHRRDRKKKKGM